jgi:hypothetical protein
MDEYIVNLDKIECIVKRKFNEEILLTASVHQSLKISNSLRAKD